MNISFDNPDKVNGLLTVVVEEADFKDNVEKELKDYRRKANVPGFRPGMVPIGIIKKRYGAAVRMDAVNKLVGEEVYKYINDNKIHMLGEPLPSASQEQVDIEKDAPYTFVFDIAVAPEFTIELSKKDNIVYYNIKADDKLIDEQVDMYARRYGNYATVDAYDPELNDMMHGTLQELNDDGSTREDGIKVDNAIMMPEYIKVDDQKKLFEGAKLGDAVIFNPRKAYPDNDAELSSLLKVDRETAKTITADFSYTITEISRFVKAEVNQELFDNAFGKDTVKSEEEFRAKIVTDLDKELQVNSDYKFIADVRAYTEAKVGTLTFPDAILKRVMLHNNKDKDEAYIEQNYAASIAELKWHLIKEQLVAAAGIKIADDDVREAACEAARMQFMQYGMGNVPDEYINNYAAELLKKKENVQNYVDSAIERKLTVALKTMVTLDEKEVSLAEFNETMKK